jgi:inosine/xanthosine triphosphate pyrophosphatase family protein
MAELTPDEKNRISHRGRAVVSVPAMIERCS